MKHLYHKTGTCSRTPEGSEVDELESMYVLADWWLRASKNQLFSNGRCTGLASHLDNKPSVGEYFRDGV
jgi:hypothetical protein